MDLSNLNQIVRHEREHRAPMEIRCCLAAGCISADSEGVFSRLKQAVQEAGLQDRVHVAGVGCMRLCSQGPLVQVEPEGALYQKVTTDTAASVVDGLQGGEVQAERVDTNSPFFELQSSVVLENSGRVEPERIETYIAANGYRGLSRVLF